MGNMQRCRSMTKRFIAGFRCNLGSVLCSEGQVNRPVFKQILTFLSSPFPVEFAPLSLFGTRCSNGAAARQIQPLRTEKLNVDEAELPKHRISQSHQPWLLGLNILRSHVMSTLRVNIGLSIAPSEMETGMMLDLPATGLVRHIEESSSFFLSLS